MKKIFSSIIILLFLLFITKEMIIHSNVIISTVSYGINIWIKNVFPALFPFFILSGILNYFGIPKFISELFKPIFQIIFKCKKEASYVFFMSMISGSPGCAKYIKELIIQNNIDDNDGTKILMFCHFVSPMFIIGTIGNFFIQDKKAIIILIISHYLGNIIIGLLFRNYKAKKQNKPSISIKKALNYINNNEKKISFGEVLSEILYNSLNTIFLILGIMIIFMLITTIINLNISLTPYHQSLLNSALEITQGLKLLSTLNISLKIKTILTTMIISFGGLSIHMQIMSILNKTKISYLPFLTARVLHALLAGLIVFILM